MNWQCRSLVRHIVWVGTKTFPDPVHQHRGQVQTGNSLAFKPVHPVGGWS